MPGAPGPRHRRERQFGVARDFDLAQTVAPVREREPADLDVVLRARRRSRGAISISSSTRRKTALSAMEQDFVVLRLAAGRLVRRGPDGAAPHVAQVDELAAEVARPVLADARDHPAAAARASAARVRDDGPEVAVREEVRLRPGRVRRPEAPDRRRRRRASRFARRSTGRGFVIETSRGMRSCSSISVARTRGSRWKRRTITESCSTFAQRERASCPGGARGTSARSRRRASSPASRLVVLRVRRSRVRRRVVERLVEPVRARACPRARARAGSSRRPPGRSSPRARSSTATITTSSARPRLRPRSGTPNARYWYWPNRSTKSYPDSLMPHGTPSDRP